MSSDQLLVLSNFLLAFVSMLLMAVTFFAIDRENRKFILDLLSLRVVSRRLRRRIRKAAEVQAEADAAEHRAAHAAAGEHLMSDDEMAKVIGHAVQEAVHQALTEQEHSAQHSA
jgi:hypothetical protein